MTENKLKEIIIWIAQTCAGDEYFGATKLNKILFFADYLYYKRNGDLLTGHTYIADKHGPVPKEIEEIKKAMLKAGDLVEVASTVGGFPQHRIMATREPKLTGFPAEKLLFLKEIIDIACKPDRSMKASKMSAMSHETIAWLTTPLKKEINPILYLFGTTTNQNRITPAHRRKAQELEERYFPVATPA